METDLIARLKTTANVARKIARELLDTLSALPAAEPAEAETEEEDLRDRLES